MMHPFTKKEIYEALVERHTAAYQEKLDAGHVAIAGLGGLGSNVAFALARLGVGHLHLIDFDRVDLTNLNRQQYLLRHVGMYKTDALKEQLLQINPYLDITTDCVVLAVIAVVFAGLLLVGFRKRAKKEQESEVEVSEKAVSGTPVQA